MTLIQTLYALSLIALLLALIGVDLYIAWQRRDKYFSTAKEIIERNQTHDKK